MGVDGGAALDGIFIYLGSDFETGCAFVVRHGILNVGFREPELDQVTGLDSWFTYISSETLGVLIIGTYCVVSIFRCFNPFCHVLLIRFNSAEHREQVLVVINRGYYHYTITSASEIG